MASRRWQYEKLVEEAQTTAEAKYKRKVRVTFNRDRWLWLVTDIMDQKVLEDAENLPMLLKSLQA